MNYLKNKFDRNISYNGRDSNLDYAQLQEDQGKS